MGKVAAIIVSLVCVSCASAQVEDDGLSPQSENQEQPLADTDKQNAEDDDAMSGVREPTSQDPEALAHYVVLLEQRVLELERKLALLQELDDRLFLVQTTLNELTEENGLAEKVLGAVPVDSELHRQFRTAAQGRINIENYTGRETIIYVNGTRWNALTGRSYIYAPVGRIAIQRGPGAEPTFKDDWRFENGELQMTVDLYD